MLTIKEINSSRNYIFLNFFTILVPIILYPFITKILTPEEFGNFIFIQAFAMLLVTICDFGCVVGFKRNYFECKSKNEKNQLLISIQIFALSIYSVIISINFLFEDLIFTILNRVEGTNNFWVLILLAASVDYITKYYLTYLVNEEKSKTYCYLLFIKNILYLVFVIFFLFNNYKIQSLVLSLLYSNLTLFCIIIIIQLRSIKFIFSFVDIKNVVLISYPLIFRTLFGQLNTKLDKILITIISSVSNTGIYSIAQSISYFIFQFTTSLDKVFITKLNKKLFSGNHNIKNYLSPYLFIVSLATISIILFNDIIYKLIIDKKYYGAGNIVIILSLHYFFLFFQKITGTQLVYLKKIWLAGNLFLLSVITNFFLNMLLINNFGVIGAALATLITSITFMIIQNIFVRKFMKLKMQMKDIFFICIVVVTFAFIQSLINIIFDQTASGVFLIVKILIFSLFIFYTYVFDIFSFRKFIKNFIKIK